MPTVRADFVSPPARWEPPRPPPLRAPLAFHLIAAAPPQLARLPRTVVGALQKLADDGAL